MPPHVIGVDLHLLGVRDGVRRTGCQEALAQTLAKKSKGRLRHGLLVESDEPRLTALLAEAHEKAGRHLALRASSPAEISAWTLVDKQAPGNLDREHRSRKPGGVWELQAKRMEKDRRFDAVVADLVDVALNGIEAFQGSRSNSLSIIRS